MSARHVAAKHSPWPGTVTAMYGTLRLEREGFDPRRAANGYRPCQGAGAARRAA